MAQRGPPPLKEDGQACGVRRREPLRKKGRDSSQPAMEFPFAIMQALLEKMGAQDFFARHRFMAWRHGSFR